ncbi:hypothetical protein IJS18_02170 [Candidatus Saccharibacteria bacterium]|nr:hypothetical protein [Candidatus Saccharibacteria bacterium]
MSFTIGRHESEVSKMRTRLVQLVYDQYSEWATNNLNSFVEGLIARGQTGTVEEFVEQDKERLDRSTTTAINAINRIYDMNDDEIRELYFFKFNSTRFIKE